ncbi:MAG: T9SS type A sorting domain-containing protein [Bacteroidota bacterium]
MKNYILIILVLLFCRSFAQNLVPNNSFEYYIDCPVYGEITKAIPWLSSYRYTINSPLKNSSDFYNVCNNSINNNFGVPCPNQNSAVNFYQNPHTGNGFAAIIVIQFGIYNYREYLEVKLTDSLKQGKKYCVEFWTNFAGDKYATDALGACLSKDTIYGIGGQWVCLINATPQINNPPGNILKDTINWVLISDTMTAQGGEQFITIGNFKNDSLTFLDTVNYYSYPAAYYLIDDVSVMECEPIVPQPDGSITVFPNPVSDELAIEAKWNSETITFDIFNAIGQIIYKGSLVDKTVINTENFAAGMYLIRLDYGGRWIYKKVVKLN